MFTRKQHQPAPARRRGFTLVEILISVALVLILILGINEVFRLTGRAVGAGEALSDITRNARNAQSIIYNDLTHADVTNGPFLFIKGQMSVAFRNREDQLNDRDFVVTTTNVNTADTTTRTIDLTRSGTETLISRPFMNRRNHRVDSLKFFTRTIARRQTGDANSFTTGVASTEQYVCYGHLQQPGNDGNVQAGHQLGIRGGGSTVYEPPTTNPNNFYAANWVLGRNVFIMQEPEPAIPPNSSTPRYMYDRSSGTPVKVSYFTRGNNQTASNSAAPFTQNSRSTTDGIATNASELIQWSYYDVAGFSMARYAADLPAYINNGRQLTWQNGFDYRFTGFPTPSKPLSRIGISRTVPCFLQHCTQFCVEYAGDFLQQSDNGTVNGVADGTGNGTDGEIDFFVDSSNRRQIRWYGFPRDTTNDGKIRSIDGDVVPLRDVAQTALKFEKAFPNGNATTVPPTLLDYALQNSLTANSVYTCAWGPDSAGFPKPKMIRITLAIDDPGSRLGEEQFFEFIVTLP